MPLSSADIDSIIETFKQAILLLPVPQQISQDQIQQQTIVITPITAPIIAPMIMDIIIELGFFQPDLPVDNQYPDRDVIIIGKDIIYRDINAFYEYI